MFLAAVILPFASGTGAAAKGLALDFVGPDDRADALSGIALIEKVGEYCLVDLTMNCGVDDTISPDLDGGHVRLRVRRVQRDWTRRMGFPP